MQKKETFFFSFKKKDGGVMSMLSQSDFDELFKGAPIGDRMRLKALCGLK